MYGLFSFTNEEAGKTNTQNVEDFARTSTEDAALLTDTKT
jgi:hypothetical protein